MKEKVDSDRWKSWHTLADAPSRLEPLNQEICETNRRTLYEFFKSQEEDKKMISQGLKRYR